MEFNVWEALVLREVTLEFTRSGGAGGQHVNRTSSAVWAVWNLPDTKAFSEKDKAWLLQKLANRLDQQGNLRLRVETERSQRSNREAALAKILEILATHLRRPIKRIKTKPTLSSKQKRLQGKAKRGNIKKLRKLDYRGED